MENHPSLQEIIIRFLVSSHSFLPNDSNFGDIECVLKFQQRMYKVEDYLNGIETCRKKNPLLVHRVKEERRFRKINFEPQERYKPIKNQLVKN